MIIFVNKQTAMEKRLQQFLSAENISQSQFADSIGVAKASVSHILAGRNKPGFDFIENMARRYPDLSIEWLISGKGKMYKSLASFQEPPVPAAEPERPDEGSLFPVEEPEDDLPASFMPEEPKPKARISKILVFYDDGTYKELE